MSIIEDTKDVDAILIWIYRLLPGYNFGEAILNLTQVRPPVATPSSVWRPERHRSRRAIVAPSLTPSTSWPYRTSPPSPLGAKCLTPG